MPVRVAALPFVHALVALPHELGRMDDRSAAWLHEAYSAMLTVMCVQIAVALFIVCLKPSADRIDNWQTTLQFSFEGAQTTLLLASSQMTDFSAAANCAFAAFCLGICSIFLPLIYRVKDVLRRVMPTVERIWMPETITLAKRKVTMPPSTQFGMSEQKPPSGPMRPKSMSQHAQATPAARDALTMALT